MSSVNERRLLVNYRVDPDVAATLLPAPLRPKLVNGWAVAGICLFPAGSATLDCALVMRDIPATWTTVPTPHLTAPRLPAL